MSKLNGKVALVTGGGRGIGRATALFLAQEGCDVAILARTPREIEQVASEIRAMGQRSIALTSGFERQQINCSGMHRSCAEVWSCRYPDE